MASAIFTRMPFGARLVTVDPSTPGQWPINGSPFGKQRLPTEPIGTFALTLTNLVTGSAIQIEDQAGTTTLYNGTAASSSATLNLNAYQAGNSLNSLPIKVRKGNSTPFYRPYETLATAFAGAQTIYVSHIPDE